MAKRSGTQDTDKGAKKVYNAADKIGRGAYVKIGVHEDSGQHRGEGALTTVEVATFHEFGTETIPERSFIRSTVDQNRSQYEQIVKNIQMKVILGQMSVDEALGLLGEKIQLDIRAQITAGIDPENSPQTIARKGSSTPLVDTGQLINSIRYEVKK